jgi:hypothetical protein
MVATRGRHTPSPRTSDPHSPVPTSPNPSLARASLPRPSRAHPCGRHALAGMAVRPSRSPAAPVWPPPEGAHPSRHRRPVPCGTFETPTRGRQAGSTTRRCRSGRPDVARPLKEAGRPSYRKGVAVHCPGSTPDSDRPLRKTVRHPSTPRRRPFGSGSCQWTTASAQRRLRVSSVCRPCVFPLTLAEDKGLKARSRGQCESTRRAQNLVDGIEVWSQSIPCASTDRSTGATRSRGGSNAYRAREGQRPESNPNWPCRTLRAGGKIDASGDAV